jgi:REP element-mobilizing transposase RayT
MSEAHEKAKKHKPRKSLRLADYDYGSSGAYSFTACTKGRKPYFKHPILELILKEEWANLPHHFNGITPDTFIIMPDHVHGIVWIDAEVEGPPTLSDVIGGYKSIINVVWLQYIKENGIRGPWQLWQRSFNDHIVRNERDLVEKQNYILNNPIVAELKEEQKKSEEGM